MNAVNPLQPTPPPAGDPRPNEPSMEEILASIRRIIADDHVAPAAPPSAGLSTQAPAAGPSGSGSLRGALRERLPFRGEDRDAPADAGDRPRPLAAAERDARTLDVPREAAARPMEADAVGDSLPAYGQVTAPQFPTPDGLPERAVPNPGAFTAPQRPVPPPDLPPAVLHDTEPRDPGARATGAWASDSRQDAAETARPAARDPDAEMGERSAALSSATTKQSVTSAFNMLAATRLTANSDELMAMVRDMIRPLLKTWLDDNLPSLVERLVRAEIERVARGGR